MIRRKRCRKCGRLTRNFAANYMAECRDCKDTLSETTQTRRRIKQKAIEHKGGACERCGYDACMRALSFHHIDPATKHPKLTKRGRAKGIKKGYATRVVNQGISVTTLSRNWEIVKKEIDKCICLCKNCHMELEDGLWEIEEVLNKKKQLQNHE